MKCIMDYIDMCYSNLVNKNIHNRLLYIYIYIYIYIYNYVTIKNNKYG